MMFGWELPSSQNRAHAADTVWARTAGGEYIRSDGAMIRRDPRDGRWVATRADGAPVVMPWGSPLRSHSLTQAKLDVRHAEGEL